VIDDSEGLVTPYEAFCHIVAVIRPDNPGLGKKVTGPHWRYEFPRDSDDALAIGNALGFLKKNLSAGKIRALGIRPRSDGPAEINLVDLRTGILKVWDGTLQCLTGDTGWRLYRDVYLSMADLNRAMGIVAQSSQALLKPAPDLRIRTEIRATYAEAQTQNVKPPNKVELGKIVQERLAKAEFYASQEQIQIIGDEDEFQKLRRPVGKTIASERAKG